MSAGYEQVLAVVLTQLASACDGERVEEDTRLGSLGLDSIAVTGLLASLGAQLERDLEPTLFWRFATPAQLCRHLCGDEGERVEPQASRLADHRQAVAITGLACRFPGADDSLAFWRLLENGGQGIGAVAHDHFTERAESGWHVAPDEIGGFIDAACDFDHERFGLGGHEASQMDPQQRLLMTLAWAALEQAGMPPAALRGQRGGVYVGAMWSDFAHHVPPQQMTAQSATGLDTSILSARISFALGLGGPSLTVNTACSSSLVALHLACQALRQGECDFAIVAGVNLMLAAHSFTAMRRFGGLSETATCHTFDAAADGYVRAEGAGVVVLRRLPDALQAASPIWGVIHASVVNNNGFHNSLTAPSMQAQQALLEGAIRQAGIAPGDVEYVEAHGTGTAMGDPIEATAIAAAYCPRDARRHPLLIGSVKTNIGHAEAAAGMAGLIKVLLALQHGVIPAHLNYRAPNPAIDWSRLSLQPVLQNTPWASAQPLAGVSSFGFGGTNAHVIVGRQWSVPADDTLDGSDLSPIVVPPANKAKGALLVFSGQGAQWPGMGLRLARLDPVFRACVARCDQLFTAMAGWSLAERLYDAEECFSDVEVAWPCHFAIQVALAEVWFAKGLRPVAAIGHSIGEVAAAHVCGVLSLRDALRVILAQARWAARRPGAMALLGLGWDAAEALLATLEVTASVAIQHADQATVISGSVDAIAQVQQHCQHNGVRFNQVRCEVAVHTGAGEDGYLALCEALEDVVPSAPHLPLLGTCSVEAAGGCLRPRYWADAVAGPVRWFDALCTALRASDGVVVEVSSHPVLQGSLREALAATAPGRGLLATARCGGSDAHALAQALDDCHEVAPLPGDSPQAMLLSGHSHAALLARCASIARWLEQDTELRLADCSQALQGASSHERHRLAFMAESPAQALACLRAALATEPAASRVCAVPLLRVCPRAPLSPAQRDMLQALPAFASGYGRVMQVAYDLGIEAHLVEGVALYIGCTELLRHEGLVVTRYRAGDTVGSMEDLVAGRSGLSVLVRAVADRDTRGWPQAEGVGDGALLCFEDLQGSTAAHLLAELKVRSYLAGVGVVALPATRQPPLALPGARPARETAPTDGASGYRLAWLPSDCSPGAGVDTRGLLVVGRAPGWSALRAHVSFAKATWHELAPGGTCQAYQRDFLELLEGAVFDTIVLLAEPADGTEHLVACVLGLLQALGRMRTGAATLHVVTRAAQRLPMDTQVDADATLLWGLLRTAQLELDGQRLCITDVGPANAEAAERDLVQATLASLARPVSQNAWRAGVRYVPALQPVPTQALVTHTRYEQEAGFHLITGGFGALGQVMLRWYFDQGERRFLLLGRRPASQQAMEAMEALCSQGATIIVERLDVADAGRLDETIERAARQLGPLTCISHAAGVLHSGALEGMTLAGFLDGVRAKREGAWNLHQASLRWPVRRFLLVSSVSSLFGFPGHAAYASGNAYLDGLAEYRLSQGLPAISARFGPFADEGLLVQGGAAQVFEHLPAIAMREALQCLEQWPEGHGHPLIMCYRGPAALASDLPALAVRDDVLANTADRHGHLCAIVSRFVASLLQVPIERISADAPLSELGVSSLLGVEIRNRLQTELQVRMPATVLWNYPTITALACYLESLLWPMEGGGLGGAEPIAEPDEDDHALMAELLRELAALKDKFREDIK